MKVLSLFDGMACGMIAMRLAGVEIESYDAYEIDKYAIKTAQHNFPMIKEHGDVFDADFTMTSRMTKSACTQNNALTESCNNTAATALSRTKNDILKNEGRNSGNSYIVARRLP